MMKEKGERMEEEGLNGLGDMKKSSGGIWGRITLRTFENTATVDIF